MQKISYLLFFAMAIFLTSCKKNVPANPKYPIVGLWTGTYSATSAGHDSTKKFFYSYTIQEGHTVLVHSLGADGNTYYGEGTWQLSGNNFSASITATNLSQQGAKQTVTAVYDVNQGKLTSGVVNSVPPGLYSAAFTLSRVN